MTLKPESIEMLVPPLSSTIVSISNLKATKWDAESVFVTMNLYCMVSALTPVVGLLTSFILISRSTTPWKFPVPHISVASALKVTDSPDIS